MATYTAYKKGGATLIGVGQSQPQLVIKHEIDLAKVIAGSNNQPAIALASNDKLTIMTIPALFQLDSLQAICQTALVLGSSPAISVGDSSSDTIFVNAASTLTAGTILTQAVTTNPLKTYATADALNLKVTGGSAATATGIIRFVIRGTDLSRDPITTT
jgi:hypothetical protein